MKNPLIGDQFFKEHPTKVLGEQSISFGRFGQKWIHMKGGTVDDIRTTHTVTRTLPRTDIALSEESIDTIIETGLASPAARPLLAPKGALELPGHPDVDSVYAIANNLAPVIDGILCPYNAGISRDELEAYLYTHTNLPAQKWLVPPGQPVPAKLFALSQDEMLLRGLICFAGKVGDADLFEYFAVYASGNVNKKIAQLKLNKEDMLARWGEAVWQQQYEMLLVSKPKTKSLGQSLDDEQRIIILPHAEIAHTFKVQEILGKPRILAPDSLFYWFIIYLKGLALAEFRLSNSAEVIKYYLQNTSMRVSDKLMGKEREDAERDAASMRQRTKQEGDRLFAKFIIENLLLEDKQRLEYLWNERYNGLAEINFDKVPVGFSFGKFFKFGPLKISKTQRDGIAYLAEHRSGICAYDVGVGKTLTVIGHLSYVLENNLSRLPLVCVPNSVYEKTINEIYGEDDTTNGKHKHGALPHLPPVRHLYNLNVDLVRKTLKDYSESEKKWLDFMTDEIGRLSVEESKLKPVQNTIDLITASRKERKKGKKEDGGFADDAAFAETISKIEVQEDFSGIPARLLDKSYKFYEITQGVIKQVRERIAGEIAIEEEVVDRRIGLSARRKNRALTEQEEQQIRKETVVRVAAFKSAIPWLIIDKLGKTIAHYLEYEVFNTGTIKPVPPGTISMCTYEGLRKLGIRDNASIISEMYSIIMQGDQYSDPREAAKLYKRIEQRLTASIANGPKIYLEDLGADYYWEDEAHASKKVFTSVKGQPIKNSETGKPEITIRDGAKYLNRENSFYDISTGSPSGLGLLTFAVCMYIQKNNDNYNVVFTTATPFENSPLEVYSMLTLANRKVLVDNGFVGLKDFFDTFMRVEWDIKVTITGGIAFDIVLTGYQNLPQLRTLIRSVIDYKTGEEANVARPTKVVLPSDQYNVKTLLRPTEEQARYMRDIEAYINNEKSLGTIAGDLMAEENAENESAEKDAIEVALENMDEDERKEYLKEYNSKKKGTISVDYSKLNEQDKLGVRIMQGISMMRQISLSPYLFSVKRSLTVDSGKIRELKEELDSIFGSDKVAREKRRHLEKTITQLEQPYTYKDYILTSPKLHYVMECIKSVKLAHEQSGTRMSGQIVYMNAGVKQFPKIKEWLVKEVGFSNEQVAFIIGGMKREAKEAIKKDFLSGKILVLIGSKAIMVGVDLQENTSTMYNCYYDWNPTDAKQFEGRGWRQNNRFGTIRIVYPMLQNSADPILFQYLQEKTLRLKDIWDKEGVKSQLDLRDFDPEKLKYELITDPHKRAKIEIMRDKFKLENEVRYLNNQGDVIKHAATSLSEYATIRPTAIEVLSEWFKVKRNTVAKKLQDESMHKLDIMSNEMKELKIELFELNESIADIGETPPKGVDIEVQKKKLEERRTQMEQKKNQMLRKKTSVQKKVDEEKTKWNERIARIEEASDNFDKKKEIDSYISRKATDMLTWLEQPLAEKRDISEIAAIYTTMYQRECKQILDRFRSSYSSYYWTIRSVAPLGITDISNLQDLRKLHKEKIDGLQKQIDKLQSTFEERVERIRLEIAAQIKYWHTPQSAAASFASLNWMLDDCTGGRIATQQEVFPTAAALPIAPEKRFAPNAQVSLIDTKNEPVMQRFNSAFVLRYDTYVEGKGWLVWIEQLQDKGEILAHESNLKEKEQQSTSVSLQEEQASIEVAPPTKKESVSLAQAQRIRILKMKLRLKPAIEQAAGIAVTYNDKILLVHPAKASWKHSYSIPKGIIERGESALDAAVREFKEETGINIPAAAIPDVQHTMTVDYDKNGKVYKQVTVFFLPLTDKQKKKLNIPEEIEKSQLQSSEVDWAGWVHFDEAPDRMLPRQLKIVQQVDVKSHL